MKIEKKQAITRRAPRKTHAPKMASAGSAPASHDDIARRAYELYLARGCADGFHLDDWLAAEAELNP
jgi:hypothetical protein